MKNITILLLLTIAVLFIQCDDEIEELCCPACPIVESISASIVAVGDTISINGKNFGRFGEGDNDRVEIGGIPALVVGTNIDTQITVEIPEDAMDGEVVVYSANATHAVSRNTLASDEDCLQDVYPAPYVQISCERAYKEELIGGYSTSIFHVKSCKLNNGMNLLVTTATDEKTTFYFIDDFGTVLDSIDWSPMSIKDILPTDDGGFLIVSGNGIKKFTSRGLSDWQKYFDSSNLECVRKLPNGQGFILIRSEREPRSDANFYEGFYRPLLIRLDANGNIYDDWFTDGKEGIYCGINEVVNDTLYRTTFKDLLLVTDNSIIVGLNQSKITRDSSINQINYNAIFNFDGQLIENSEPYPNFPHWARWYKLENDDFFVLGHSYLNEIVVATVDEKGLVMGNKATIPLRWGDWFISSVIKRESGYLICGDTSIDIDTNNQVVGTLIIELDEFKKPIKWISFNKFSKRGDSVRGQSMHSIGNGKYFLSGKLHNKEKTKYRAYYAIVDCI